MSNPGGGVGGKGRPGPPLPPPFPLGGLLGGPPPDPPGAAPPLPGNPPIIETCVAGKGVVGADAPLVSKKPWAEKLSGPRPRVAWQ